MPQTPADAEASMIQNLEGKTGKALPAWLKLVAKTRLAKHGEIVAHLKTEHGVTHGYANLIAHRALRAADGGGGDDGDLVAAQFSGKEALKPIYDALVKAVRGFGADVEIAPKKTYVSLRRSKQFALVQPSTRTRIDVGINLKGVAPKGRLEASGSFNAMVSHRVRVSALEEVDAELIGWLKRAFAEA